MDEWVRERAHAAASRCRGGEKIGDDHVRYHSAVCDNIAAALHEAITRERARILNKLRNPTEEMQRIALNVQLPGPGEPPLWRKLLDAIAEHLENDDGH